MQQKRWRGASAQIIASPPSTLQEKMSLEHESSQKVKVAISSFSGYSDTAALIQRADVLSQGRWGRTEHLDFLFVLCMHVSVHILILNADSSDEQFSRVSFKGTPPCLETVSNLIKVVKIEGKMMHKRLKITLVHLFSNNVWIFLSCMKKKTCWCLCMHK